MPRLSWISVLVVVVGCTCVALSSEAETAGTSAQGVLSLVCGKGALLCVCLSLLQLPRVAYKQQAFLRLKAGTPRSKRWQIQCLGRATCWFIDGLLPAMWSQDRGRGALWGLIY